jgi:hypothetical protein
MDDYLDLATFLEAAAARLRTLRPPSFFDVYRDGKAITADEAAYICNCSPETIRRRCAAADNTRPLGKLIAHTLWLIDLAGLLDWIEVHQGKPARLAAETRARENAKTRPRQHNSLPFVATATSAE